MSEAVATPEVKQYKTVDELTAAIKGNRELVEEYSKLIEDEGEEGEAKFIAKYVKSEGEAAAEDEPAAVKPKDEPEATAAPESNNDDKEAAPADKGDGASVSDAEKRVKELENQLEMYRGARIPELEGKLRELEGAKKALEDALNESRQKSEEALKAPLPEEITLDDLGDDIDLLDTENQKKVLKNLKALPKLVGAFKTVAQQLKEAKAAAAQAQADAKLANTTVSERGQRENELDEIDAIRRENRELFSERPIKEIEDDFHAFMTGLAKAIGFKGKVEENGVFAPEVQQAYTKYHTDKDMKAKAEAEGLALPKDFDDLVLVHKLRTIKNSNREVEVKDGKEVIRPWNYRKALEYLDKSTVKPDPKLEQARSKREAEERAVENRKKFAREIPLDKGANPVDASKISVQEWESRLKKYLNPMRDPAPEEREWLVSAMKLNGMPPEEIEMALTVERKTRKKKE